MPGMGVAVQWSCSVASQSEQGASPALAQPPFLMDSSMIDAPFIGFDGIYRWTHTPTIS